MHFLLMSHEFDLFMTFVEISHIATKKKNELVIIVLTPNEQLSAIFWREQNIFWWMLMMSVHSDTLFWFRVTVESKYNKHKLVLTAKFAHKLNLEIIDKYWLGLWCLTPLSTIFKFQFNNIVSSTRRHEPDWNSKL